MPPDPLESRGIDSHSRLLQNILKPLIEALNRADVNLFCCDPGLIQGQSIFFALFLYLFQKPKHLFKENVLSKLLKVTV